MIRFTLPYADPYLFPLVAVLACFGLVIIYRIDEDLAREQAQWFVVGLVAVRGDDRRCCATSACSSATATRSPRSASRCCCCRACRASASRSTAPTSASSVGPISFQPAEFAKIAIVIFLASYLRDTRQVLVHGARRVLGVTIPPLKHFGPLLVVWGAAMLMLVFIRDLGSSLMFFGGFLALLYVATNRLLVRARRPGAVRRRRLVLRSTTSATCRTASTSGCDPFAPLDVVERRAATRSPSACSRRPTAGCSGTGFGAGAARRSPGGGPLILPAPHTDLIYAVIVDELGLSARAG